VVLFPFSKFYDDSQSVLRRLSSLIFINILSRSHSMECKSLLFVMNHIRNLWGFSSSFSNSFIDLQLRSCFIIWYEKERSTKLRIYNGGWHETWNLPHVSSCEMFTFCVVLQKKNGNKLLRVHSVGFHLEFDFVVPPFILNTYNCVTIKSFCWKNFQTNVATQQH